MINDKKLKYSLSPFTSLTIFITSLASFFLCLHLIHCFTVTFVSVIISGFHLYHQQKWYVRVDESLQHSHRRYGRKSCVFASIWIKALNKWKVNKKIIFISNLWVILMIKVVNLMIELPSTVNLYQKIWTSYESDALNVNRMGAIWFTFANELDDRHPVYNFF